MTGRLLRLGPLLVLLLAGAAAIFSLAGHEPVERLAGSGWFVALAALVGLLSLVAALAGSGPKSDRLLHFVTHLGLFIGLAGIGLNQLRTRSGYLFLETSTEPAGTYLSRSLRTVEPLPFAVRLDSLSTLVRRGFQPAPAAWLSPASAPVSYNRPLRCGGTTLLFLRRTEPGFPHQYELAVGTDEYLLLHNQRVRLKDGRDLSSFGFDDEAGRLALSVGDTSAWLAPGETLRTGSAEIVLGPVHFSGRPGAVFAVRSGRLRPLIFAGFGLMLVAVAGRLLRKEPV